MPPNNQPSNEPRHPLDALERSLRTRREAPLTLGGVVEPLITRDPAFVLVLLALPFVQPLGLPFLGVPFAALLALVGLSLALDRPLSLPRWLARQPLPRGAVEGSLGKLRRWTGLLQRRSCPRLRFLLAPWATRTLGATVFILALALALPLPIPFTNFVCALPMLLLGLGHVQRDGALILAGYCAVLPCALLFGGLLWAGQAAIESWSGWMG